MNFVWSNSQEGHTSQIDLFSTKPYNAAISSREYIIHRPSANIIPGAPIDITVHGSPTAYIDLKRSYQCMQVKIVKGDGTALQHEEPASATASTDTTTTDSTKAEVDDVTFINNIGDSFRQVDVKIGYKNSTSEVNINHAFKSMIDFLLETTEEAKNGQLSTIGYAKDTAEYIDVISTEARPTNTGAYIRKRWTENSETIHVQSPINADICKQDKLILCGVDLQFKYFPNTNEFLLLTSKEGADYKVVICDFYLVICSVTLRPDVLLAQAKVLETNPVVYDIEKSYIRTYAMAKGIFAFNTELSLSSWIPDSVIICFVDSESYNGSYKRNPYNFKHNNLSFAAITIDGQTVNGRPYEPNMENKNFNELYNALFYKDIVKQHGNGIRFNDFRQGYFFIVFNITDTLGRDFTCGKRKGFVNISLRFSKALENSTTVICYSRVNSTFTIDGSRNVTFD